jgi:UDP-N-acetylglucosamine 2-epimerase
MYVLSVVGARPQFIKAAPISEALKNAGHREFLVHTGQHYDENMSRVFFEEMGIPKPDMNLGIGSGKHGEQTGKMIAQIEPVLLEQKPDVVLVHGDTNSTLATAVATCKLQIKLAHNEAGLRSFNRSMPEEHNRVLTDHCSDLLFCPTDTAVNQLAKEGITTGVNRVGDVMYDASLRFADVAADTSKVMETHDIEPGSYLLATVHRPYNTDDPERLGAIMQAFIESGKTVVFPVHPRTRQKLQDVQRSSGGDVRLIDPVGYLDMVQLEKHAAMILTDSGGVQKEAFFHSVPCVTLRPETEWVETVESGWNRLADANAERILEAISRKDWPTERPVPYGDGHAADRIVEILGKS